MSGRESMPGATGDARVDTGIDDVQAWLDARVPPAPPELRAHIDRALAALNTIERDGPILRGAPIVARLAEAALHALGVAVEKCDDRAAATDLLAADALFTYAMEAAAEVGSDAVEAAAQTYGGARLLELLPEQA